MTAPTLPPITEKAFMGQVVQLARLRSWRVYHTHDSRRSAAGFPDLVMCRPPRLVIAELKRGPSARVTPEQLEWLEMLRVCPGVEFFLWTPEDWCQIERVLE